MQYKGLNTSSITRFPEVLYRVYGRGYKRYIIPGLVRMKVHTLHFAVIKPKITGVSQLQAYNSSISKS